MKTPNEILIVASRLGELREQVVFVGRQSFKGRGEGDYYHHAMEDLLVLVDGRPELLAELLSAPEKLRAFVAKEFTKLLQLRDFRDCLPGHLAPDAASQGRLPLLLRRLQSIAELINES